MQCSCGVSPHPERTCNQSGSTEQKADSNATTCTCNCSLALSLGSRASKALSSMASSPPQSRQFHKELMYYFRTLLHFEVNVSASESRPVNVYSILSVSCKYLRELHILIACVSVRLKISLIDPSLSFSQTHTVPCVHIEWTGVFPFSEKDLESHN